ncbi:MAG: MiaB/RimO family radical SAM methylthiotransferase [Clostridia bacterium]|nr:MiaB/RimO family radical SAM methylthiotransferase [Clostridia bacterium]
MFQELVQNSGFRIPNLVGPLDGASFEPMCVKNAPRTRAYVKIEDGCECRCSYCAISAARGPVRSKQPEAVISEVEGLYKKGTLEIVLTGIETGSYGADFDKKYDLADLLRELDARHSCERIRLGSMAPELLSDSFVSSVAGLKIMVPHFHISMQSGSDNVLRGMKRRYNRSMALKNIARIRELMPDVMLTADLMVGFPGESEEDFLDTMRFVREARLLDAHVFAYSRREGTPAADYPNQIPEQIKHERSQRLISECAAVRDEILSEVVNSGRSLSCILESWRGGVYTAHSDSYIEVCVEGERGLTGSMVLVKPLRHENGKIYGKII